MLHFSLPQSDFHDKMKGYLLHLSSLGQNLRSGQNFELMISNHVWLEQKLQIQTRVSRYHKDLLQRRSSDT